MVCSRRAVAILGAGTASTGWWASWWLTDPRTRGRKPPKLCEPTRISAASCSSATATIVRHGFCAANAAQLLHGQHRGDEQ